MTIVLYDNKGKPIIIEHTDTACITRTQHSIDIVVMYKEAK
jgi:hypothetical protein